MCTHITLRNEDGSFTYGRTMEWGAFDMRSRMSVVPPGLSLTGTTPDGKPGKTWTSRLGVVGIDMVEQATILGDGVNEAGLAVGLLYHPGFAAFPPYDPARAAETIAPTDLPLWALSQFATVAEVRDALTGVQVADIVVAGTSTDSHAAIVDASGDEIVVEFTAEGPRIFDNPLGVLTNAPTFDWHTTNLRNYVNLSPVGLPSRELDGLDFSPLGAGSGFIGLPGDFTPPSRFVRAVAWSQTARPTANAAEGVYEAFRILDNFNVPLGAAEGSDANDGGGGDAADPTAGLRSDTQWTVAYDLATPALHYHTQHNRRVRRIDVAALDFAALGGEIHSLPLDRAPEEDIEDRTADL